MKGQLTNVVRGPGMATLSVVVTARAGEEAAFDAALKTLKRETSGLPLDIEIGFPVPAPAVPAVIETPPAPVEPNVKKHAAAAAKKGAE